MMISPEMYANSYKGKSYEELIVERDRLIAGIKVFEEGQIPQEQYAICPTPDTRYRCQLKYLIEICKLIVEAYNAKSDYKKNKDAEKVPVNVIDYAEEYKRQTGKNLDEV